MHEKGSITAAVVHHAYKQYSETYLAMQATFLWIPLGLVRLVQYDARFISADGIYTNIN